MNRVSIGAAMLIAGGGLAAALTPAASAASAHRTVIDSCAGSAQHAPRQLTLYCADANDTLTHLKWAHWGAAMTTASGENAVDDCSPSCVAGHTKSYPVTVKLTDRTRKAGTTSYGKLTLTYRGKVPKGQPRSETFKLTRRGPVAA